MSDPVLYPRANHRARAGDVGTPRVEVRLHAPHTTVVTLIGEHDLATTPRLLEAFELASQERYVVIDLTPCTFVDSSLVSAVLSLRRMQAGGELVGLVVAEGQRGVRRTLEMLRIDELFPVHGSLDEALRAARKPEAAGGPGREA